MERHPKDEANLCFKSFNRCHLFKSVSLACSALGKTTSREKIVVWLPEKLLVKSFSTVLGMCIPTDESERTKTEKYHMFLLLSIGGTYSLSLQKISSNIMNTFYQSKLQ